MKRFALNGSLLIVVFFCTANQPAQAAGAAPKNPSQLAALLGTTSSPTCISGGVTTQVDQQIAADGSTIPFTIPPGQVFVVTRFTWAVSFSTATHQTDAVLSVATPSTNGSIAIAPGSIDANGNGGGSADLGYGVAVKAGSQLCVGMPSGIGGASFQGFFTKDK